MENLLEGALSNMEETISQSGLIVSPEARKMAVADVHRDVHDMMYPFFKRFVQMARQDAAKSFNAAVADELEVSIKLMDDLRTIKRKAIAEYQSQIRQLTPKNSPEKWKNNYEVAQFARSLDDFIEMREEQAKLQGILPRGRRPIEVSVYHFLLHPLGRDHRQDPLGCLDSDVIEYNPQLASCPDVTVSPSLARHLATTPAAREFAREMLMLPLSIKNPSIPMTAKRSQKNVKPPKKVVFTIPVFRHFILFLRPTPLLAHPTSCVYIYTGSFEANHGT